jgi:hypothetical protein
MNGSITRKVATGVGIAAAASAVPFATSTSPAAATSHCTAGFVCYWQNGGFQFQRAGNDQSLDHFVDQGFNNGTTGRKVCGYEGSTANHFILWLQEKFFIDRRMTGLKWVSPSTDCNP